MRVYAHGVQDIRNNHLKYKMEGSISADTIKV